MRIWRWFRRNSRAEHGHCFACRAALDVCNTCTGEYLAARCATCTTGLTCTTTHGKLWF